MKKNKPDSTNSMQENKLHIWYKCQNFKNKTAFRKALYSELMHDVKKPNYKFWNWMSGKSTIPQLALPFIFETILTIDESIEYAEQLDFKFNPNHMKNKIHKLLYERNMKRKDLKELTGLSLATISMVANEAVKNPDTYTLQKIAAAFDLPIDEVFEINIEKKIA